MSVPSEALAARVVIRSAASQLIFFRSGQSSHAPDNNFSDIVTPLPTRRIIYLSYHNNTSSQ
ncbi:MAG TPA: hypothetical protein VFM68_02910 [Candidatus Saccharimonadales bacterium]|nr:hypothetical protein [Candidatus Saccharimonadales bacterium]